MPYPPSCSRRYLVITPPRRRAVRSRRYLVITPPRRRAVRARRYLVITPPRCRAVRPGDGAHPNLCGHAYGLGARTGADVRRALLDRGRAARCAAAERAPAERLLDAGIGSIVRHSKYYHTCSTASETYSTDSTDSTYSTYSTYCSQHCVNETYKEHGP